MFRCFAIVTNKTQKILREFRDFDVLSDVLGSLEFRSRLFCRSDLAAPWSMQFPASPLTHFHIVERGGACLELVDKAQSLTLAPGDVIVVASHTAYRLVDTPGREDYADVPLPLADASGQCTVIRRGGKGPSSVMLCGSFSLGRPEIHPILSLLPRVIHIQAGTSSWAGTVEPICRILTNEASEVRPGSEMVMSRLTDILFVQVLRNWLMEMDKEPSWLAAIRDPRIGPALALMHERPGFPWTTQKLAQRVGLSRSPFTVRFTKLLGEPPQNYLARIRMQRAAQMILTSSNTLNQIAASVGYESEASFNKAFKRHIGVTPGRYRRQE